MDKDQQIDNLQNIFEKEKEEFLKDHLNELKSLKTEFD